MAEFDPKSWAWWQKALAAKAAGNAALIGSKDLPIGEEPMTGLYRMKTYAGGPYIPLQFWYDGGGLRCDRNGKGKRVDEATARGAWQFGARNPITAAQYTEWQETGKWWDEERVVVNGQEQSSHVEAPAAAKPPRARPRKNKDEEIEAKAEPVKPAPAAAPAKPKKPVVDWGDDDDDQPAQVTAPAASETVADQASQVAAATSEPVETSSLKADLPVRYFWHPESASLFTLTDPKDIADTLEKEPLVSEIDEDRYHELKEDEAALAQQNERAQIGGNNPPDAFAELKDSIAEWRRTAARLEKAGAVTTQDQADKLADVKSKLGELWKAGEDMRKAEKKPHDDAGKAVQEKFRSVLESAVMGQEAMSRMLGPFFREQERIERERVKALEEANREKVEAGEVVRQERPRSVGAGNRRKVSQVRSKQAVLEDVVKAAEYFAKQPRLNKEFEEIILKLGKRVMDAGGDVPGMKLVDAISVR